MAPVIADVTASTAVSGEVECNENGEMDLTLLKGWRLDGDDLIELFQVSRTSQLSPSVLHMLHRASNNLLPSFEASEIVGIIRLGSGRQVFNALIST